MKTIKLIDLFIKIAKGEKTPYKIKFNNYIYEHCGDDSNSYYYCKERNKLLENDFIFEELNEELEIIEDKKIELIKEEVWELNNAILKNKINEIIDRINGE